MKQLILLMSMLSWMFTFNNFEDRPLRERISGGWTLLGGNSKIEYYDANNNLINEKLLPLKISGSILNINDSVICIRNNNNQLIYADYSLNEEANTYANLQVNDCSELNTDDISSLLQQANFDVKNENKQLLLTADFGKDCASSLLDKSIDFDHAKVKMVFHKNSFFADWLPN